jgi:hypothetical protein
MAAKPLTPRSLASQLRAYFKRLQYPHVVVTVRRDLITITNLPHMIHAMGATYSLLGTARNIEEVSEDTIRVKDQTVYSFEILHGKGESGQYSGTDLEYIREQRKGFKALGVRVGKIQCFDYKQKKLVDI